MIISGKNYLSFNVISLLISFYLSSTYLLDVLAVSSRLFSGQTDKQTTACLSAVSLLQLEHVSAGLADSRHFSDDGQIVDNKADLGLLVSGESLCMAQ